MKFLSFPTLQCTKCFHVLYVGMEFEKKHMIVVHGSNEKCEDAGKMWHGPLPEVEVNVEEA